MHPEASVGARLDVTGTMDMVVMCDRGLGGQRGVWAVSEAVSKSNAHATL